MERQGNEVKLTLWTDGECVQSEFLAEAGLLSQRYEADRSAFEPVVNWLAGQGVEDLQAVVWEGTDSSGREREVRERAGLSSGGNHGVDEADSRKQAQVWQEHGLAFLARELARIYRGSLCEIPAWWEEELPEPARVSGFPGIERRGVYDRIAHMAALCQAEQEAGLSRKSRIIVASLGEGVSVAAYVGGKLLDVNNARDGEGPMGLTCAGSLPTEPLVHWAFSGGKSRLELERGLTESGGWAAYSGKMSREKWEEVLVYQVLKEIGGMRAVLQQEVDRVILTGDRALGQELTERIRESLPSNLPVQVIPGVNRALGLARIWLTDIRAERGKRREV